MAVNPVLSICILIFIGTAICLETKLNPLSNEFIDLINEKQNTWKAGRNFPEETTYERVRSLMGSVLNPQFNHLETLVHNTHNLTDLPESFDPRTKWPNCPSLNEIRDQGDCGSCWAIGSVSVMIDRICIHLNGSQVLLSVQDLVSCCPNQDEGCQGNDPWLAWEHYRDIGIVSGGQYGSGEGCRPYEIPPCKHFVNGRDPPCGSYDFLDTPKCKAVCIDSYNVSYENDKHYAEEIYHIKNDEVQIMTELLTNGPIAVAFMVMDDFLHYKSGVYRYESGELVYGHVVKLLGWGVEDGTKYWLLANSFNTDWGDNGFFKFLRGENHLNIESAAMAGIPRKH